MDIGLPTEIKPQERRVALIPAAVADMVARGHRVFVQSGAGVGSGYADQQYLDAGAVILDSAQAVYKQARLIVKVKEPIEGDLELLTAEHCLFSFLHLAAAPVLTKRLCGIGLTAVAFETVVDNKRLPILTPMSDIAGRLSVQLGAHYLQAPAGGKGLLLGGLPSVDRGHVVVLGAGNAGSNAVRMAADMGARVSVFDKNPQQLEIMHHLSSNVTALMPYHQQLKKAVIEADLLIGAVLIPGAKAPKLVPEEWVSMMQAGSVVVDIAVDQGGCIETIRPTNYDDPVYMYQDVLHLGVTNLPGAVPRSASAALSAAHLPYLQALANDDWQTNAILREAINIQDGRVVHAAITQ